MMHNGYRQRNARLYIGMKKDNPTGISAPVRSARNPTEPAIDNGTTPPLRRAAAFLRSATVNPAQIDQQRREIEAFAARENFELDITFVFDGVGGNDKEPIKKVLKQKSDHDLFDFLIVAEPSRLTRGGFAEMSRILYELSSAGVVVIALNLGVLNDTPAVQAGGLPNGRLHLLTLMFTGDCRDGFHPLPILTGRRAAGYISSVTRTVAEFQHQENVITAFANSQGIELMMIHVHKGKKKVDIKTVLDILRNEGIDTLLVADLMHLSNDHDERREICMELRKAGTMIVAIREELFAE
jgi:DNA invertase Pin-like site-specific DNA recombinase